MSHPISRRAALRQISAGTVLLAGVAATPLTMKSSETTAPAAHNGRIKQSVCQWCYKLPLEELCAAAAGMGLRSVELIQPKDFATVRKHGLICAMTGFPTTKVGDLTLGGIDRGWNRLEYHDALLPIYEAQIRATAEAGYPNQIVFSGNRAGMADDAGLENCVTGLKRLLPLAEKLGVTVCMELLNSRVNHKDYMCDHTAWGVDVMKRMRMESAS